MINKDYKIVTSELEIPSLLSYIKSKDFFSFDTETTGLNVRKDKVIGMSFCAEYGKAFYVPLLTWSKEKQVLIPVISHHSFIAVLNKLATKDLLMWNASYDVRIVRNHLKVDLINALVADVMLMKHTVDEEGDFALKKVAISLQSEIGLDVEKEANEEQIKLKENIATNGGSTTKTNYEMFKADLDVMGAYAAADADLTLRLADYFQKKLTEQNLEYFFYDFEVMPLYKEVTILMEDKGIQLDMDLILETRAKIQFDIDKLYTSIKEEIMSHERFIEWRKHKALAEFPYSIKGRFASKFLELNNVPLKKTEKGSYSFTAKNIESLPVEYDYYKAFLLGEITLTNDEIEQTSLALLLEDPEYFNINSKSQLGEIVFNYMGIKSLSNTSKGSPQFNDEMIQNLVDKYDISWAKKLSNYNKLIKIKSTYIDRFLDEQEDGIFYPTFFQHRTISGRFGSNLQQLPRVKEDGELDEVVLQYTNLIRSFFISGDGRIFVDNDYESLEPHVFAHVSGDQKLKDIFLKGHDFYSTIAIATEKLEGVSADKKADNYLGKVNKPKRQSAKSFSLGVPYGMKGYALGMTLGISTEEAEALVEGYLNGFPELKKWMEQSDNMAKFFGEVKTETGRTRHLYKVKELYAKHKDNLLDYKYRNSLSKRFDKEEVKQWYADYKNGLNNAKNFQIQGLSASIVNLAAIAINRKLKSLGIDGWVVANIHDQLIVNVPEDKAEECKQLVQDTMENNYKISIPLKAPAALGKNFKDAH